MNMKKIISFCMTTAFSVSLAVCSAEPSRAVAINIPNERISETAGIGLLQGVYSFDIDNDNEKEQIAIYKNISDYRPYIVETFCEVYDNGSSELLDTFFTVNEFEYFVSHIIYDGNTGKTFVGYEHLKYESLGIYNFKSSEPVAVKERNGKDGMTEDEYNAYIEKVVFLDEVYRLAYSKGDADGDAELTLNDASFILSCYAKNMAGLESDTNNNIEEQAADIDNDGSITLSDATAVLSTYAESMAGLIDTVLLPYNIVKDRIYDGDVSTAYITRGTLESIFYYDIDNDGRKETIGRYKDCKVEDCDYGVSEISYQVYDSGTLSQSFIGIGGMVIDDYFFINDKNINEIYLAHKYERGSGMYGYAGITKAYPNDNLVLYVDGESYPEPTEIIEINNQSATRQELYDYISNMEIISPYQNDDNELDFDWIFDTYCQ